MYTNKSTCFCVFYQFTKYIKSCTINSTSQTKQQTQQMKGQVNDMKDITITFTREELQLLYAACMNYGDKLADLAKGIPNEEEIGDSLIVKAKQTWELAGKIISMEEK